MDKEDKRRYFVVGSVYLEVVTPLFQQKLEEKYQGLNFRCLKDFLDRKAVIHILFHLRHRNAWCCTDKANCRSHGALPLNHHQWKQLYAENPGPGIHNCFCKYTAKSVEPEDLDVSLCGLILFNCCNLGPLDQEAVSILRRNKNDYLSHNTTCGITKDEYGPLMDELKTNILQLDQTKEDELIRIQNRPLDDALCNKYMTTLLNIHEILEKIDTNTTETLRYVQQIWQHLTTHGLTKQTSDEKTDKQEYTTKTNEASSNVITVNKTFIMKEMDSLIALEVLRRSHCNISHISGDRLQKLPFIIKILENEPEKYLDDLLKGLQEEKAMKGLCLRLQNSRKIFSVNIAQKDLVANLLQHYYDDVVKILKVDELYQLLIDELKERKIISQLDEEGPISTTKDKDLDENVYNLITTVIRKGRNAMLNFVDILLKNDQEVIAFKLLKKVPNQNSKEKRGNHKHPIKSYKLGQSIFIVHHQIDLTSIVGGDRRLVSDIVMMDDDRLVMCLPIQMTLLICNTDGSQLDSIHLQGNPECVTAVNNSTVAVTLWSVFIEMYDINNKLKLKSISLPGMWCWGSNITTINNKLVVRGDNRLHIIDHQTGEVVQSIKTDCYPGRLHGSGDRIFYSDYKNKLYWYSYTDDSHHTLTLPSPPGSMTTLQDGSLYVVCSNGSIQHVSSDGKQYKSVTTKGLQKLKSTLTSYNSKQRKLIIKHEKEDNRCVFNVLYEE